MATEPKAATEDVKIDLFEDDDEFEEFEINEGKFSTQISFTLFRFLIFVSGMFYIWNLESPTWRRFDP